MVRRDSLTVWLVVFLTVPVNLSAPARTALSARPCREAPAPSPGAYRVSLSLASPPGYLPIDRQAATLFFQLISRRYERGPMILTQQPELRQLGDVFGDRVIASAILDRILHHATTISIRGDSDRLKDKLKSGVVKPTTAGA